MLHGTVLQYQVPLIETFAVPVISVHAEQNEKTDSYEKAPFAKHLLELSLHIIPDSDPLITVSAAFL